MDQEVLDKLSKLNWAEIGQKVMAVAVFWSKIYYGPSWKDLPKGYTHEDVLQESFRRLFSHEWTNCDEGKILQFAFGAVRSVLSNLAKSAKSQNTHSLDLFALQVIDPCQTFEDTLDRKETLNDIRKRIADQEDLTKTFEDIIIGMEPKEIADKQGLSISEVYNIKKRLLRIVENIAIENNHGSGRQ